MKKKRVRFVDKKGKTRNISIEKLKIDNLLETNGKYCYESDIKMMCINNKWDYNEFLDWVTITQMYSILCPLASEDAFYATVVETWIRMKLEVYYE